MLERTPKIRHDKPFKRRFRGLISEILTNVVKSEKNAFQYFNPSYKNKKLFKFNSEWAEMRPGHANSIFGRDESSELRWNNFTEVMFSQMMREFKLRRVYLLMPNKDGEFRSSQAKLLTRFTDLIISKMEAKEEVNEKQLVKDKNGNYAEIIAQTEKNLSDAKLEAIKKLGYNEGTGLIQGTFANIMDPDGMTLGLQIDPANPDLAIFINRKLGIGFVMDNDRKDLMKLEGRSTAEATQAEGIAVAEVPKAEELNDKVNDEANEVAILPQIAVQTEEGAKEIPHEDLQEVPHEAQASIDEGTSHQPVTPEEYAANYNQIKSNRQGPPRLARRMEKNTMVEANLKGELPISTTITGADGQKRERLPEQNLAKREQEKAVKQNLPENEQTQLAEGGKGGDEGDAKQKQPGPKKESSLLKWAFGAGAAGIAFFS